MCDRLPKPGAAQLGAGRFCARNALELRAAIGGLSRVWMGAEPNPTVPQTVVSRGLRPCCQHVRKDNPAPAAEVGPAFVDRWRATAGGRDSI